MHLAALRGEVQQISLSHFGRSLHPKDWAELSVLSAGSLLVTGQSSWRVSVFSSGTSIHHI